VESSAVCRFAKSLGFGLLITLGLASHSPAQPSLGARYLIIAPDSFVPALRPLAQWKTEKGMLAKIVTLGQTGNTPQQVRSYIRNAWQTWPVRPEYVLIACSPAYVPGYTWDNDCYYGNMSGDYRMEISVGRLPAENVYECRTMVAKTLAYEQPPASSDTCWYLQGTTCVGEDDPGNPDQYYLPDSRFVRGLWQNAGYLKTESLYNLAGDSTPQLIAALNGASSPIAAWPGPTGISRSTSSRTQAGETAAVCRYWSARPARPSPSTRARRCSATSRCGSAHPRRSAARSPISVRAGTGT
jgi:hypothetical protein